MVLMFITVPRGTQSPTVAAVGSFLCPNAGLTRIALEHTGRYQQLCARPLSRVWSYINRRSLSGLPPHFRRERRIKRWGIAAGTATGAALGTKSNAKAERKCQNFALVTTLFSGSASPRRVGRGSSQYLLPSSPVATHFPALSATMPRGGGSNTARRRYAALVRCMRLAVVLCYNFVSNSAWLYPLTPLVIMPRKSSREKSESRNTSSGFIPSCLPIS